jgi:gamma-glutamylputrescine synthase
MIGSKIISNFYAQKENLLRSSLEIFLESVKLIPRFGVELEFYLRRGGFQTSPNVNYAVKEQAGLKPAPTEVYEYIANLKNLLPQIIVEKERGEAQIEIKTHPTSDLSSLAQDIENIKSVAKNLAQQKNLIADFSSQPFIDDCGSALQFNFSLHDNDKNLFAKKNELFFSSIAGMLDIIDEMTIFCAPQEEDYLRFDLEINRNLHKKGKFTAPVNISFGNDNRSAAIRIPPCENLQQNRIEFRVAGADADPYLVMTSLLVAVERAILLKLELQDSQKVFGNAFDEQYNLKSLAKNLSEAQEKFLQGKVIRNLL